MTNPHNRESYRNLFLPGIRGNLTSTDGLIRMLDRARAGGHLDTAEQRLGMEDALRDQRNLGPADDDEKLLEALAYLKSLHVGRPAAKDIYAETMARFPAIMSRLGDD